MAAPGQEQFNRVCIVQMGTVQVQGLRTQFKVVKNNDEAPNTAEISVWNLAETTRQAILTFANSVGNVPVILQAGYGTPLAAQVLFAGDILPYGLSITRNGPDWLMTFKAGDGLSSYRSDRISLKAPPGMSASALIQQIMGQFKGIDTKDAMAKIGGMLTGGVQQFTKGTVVTGGAMQELNRLLKSYKVRATCQDGKLDVAPIDSYVAGASAPSLSSATGLLGSPTPGKDRFVKFKCWLRPEIKVWRQVFVTAGSPPKTTILTAHKVEHTGDTRGPPWYTEVEGKA